MCSNHFVYAAGATGSGQGGAEEPKQGDEECGPGAPRKAEGEDGLGVQLHPTAQPAGMGPDQALPGQEKPDHAMLPSAVVKKRSQGAAARAGGERWKRRGARQEGAKAVPPAGAPRVLLLLMSQGGAGELLYEWGVQCKSNESWAVCMC